MDLLRDWRRRTFGAMAGAAIAPAAIIGATLAVGVGGGLGDLGSIGQALNGPDLPAVAPGPNHDTGTAAVAGRLLEHVRPVPGASPQPNRPGGAPSPGAATPGADPATPAAPPASSAPAPAAPAPAATSTPSVVDQLGRQVTSITDQVPVAGEPVGEVVGLLTDTLDGLSAGPGTP